MKIKYKKPKRIKRHFKSFIIILFFIFFLLALVYKNITASVFLKKKDRINIVFYGQNTLFYSLNDDVNYFFALPSDIEVLVPGGYGYYRLGGLGKLIFLEKKPDIFRNTFSSLTSSMIDLYFYPPHPKIYYGETEIPSVVIFPSLSDIFFNKSNGNIIDRIYLSIFFLNKNRNRYKLISRFAITKRENRALFNQEDFFKVNQGLFYKKSYRDIKNNVQIIYTKSYKTAKLLSRIIEGEGIRVVDLSQIQSSKLQLQNSDKCLVIEQSKKPSVIAADLQKFFECRFKSAETEISDIILILGQVETEWQID